MALGLYYLIVQLLYIRHIFKSAHSREKTKCGSVLKISWTSDGTQLAGAGANGQVLFGQLIDRHLEWGSFDVCLDENDHIKVTDTLKQVCINRHPCTSLDD